MTRTWLFLFGLLAATLLSAGCSPAHYRRQADQRAYDIISRANKQALGRTDPFTIETPADTLRRRLLLDQELPISNPASLGTSALTPIKHWPEKDYPIRQDDLAASGAWQPAMSQPAQTQPSAVEPAETPLAETQPATSQPSTQEATSQPATAPAALVLTLNDALQVAAKNNREYQTRKEDVYQTALALDLESNEFRSILAASSDATYVEDRTGDDPVRGVTSNTDVSVSRRLKQGTALTAAIGLDLVSLLNSDHNGSMGLTGDASITVPLLRGAGQYIVAEPLTQAQRNVIYSLYSLERTRRILAVQVASEYLGVLQQMDQVDNAEENYRQLVLSSRRARRLSEAGRLEAIQVDQASQDELRARERWIIAHQTFGRALDSFKIILGLPTDATLELDRGELQRLARAAQDVMSSAATPAQERLAPMSTEPAPGEAPPDQATSQGAEAQEAQQAPNELSPLVEQTDDPEAQSQPASAPADETLLANQPVDLIPPSHKGGPLEMDEAKAIRIALDNRLDLRTAIGQVYDAQRHVVVAANALKADVRLVGTAAVGESRSLGSANQPDARFQPQHGVYAGGVQVDLPLERTAERNVYRNSLINLEQSTRNVQALEDQIKLQVRDDLRRLLQARESYLIQVQAARLAERRVTSTELFLQAGRAQIRDLLEAQESLIQARNAVTAALVDYRVTALEFQRDLDVLQIDEKGLWREYQPN